MDLLDKGNNQESWKYERFWAKMMSFCKANFWLSHFVKHGNVGSYLSYPCFKTTSTFHIYPSNQKVKSLFWTNFLNMIFEAFYDQLSDKPFLKYYLE